MVSIPVTESAVVDPNLYHINPIMELDSIVQMLWNAVYVPIAVAVSVLTDIFVIQAFDMPSVAEA